MPCRPVIVCIGLAAVLAAAPSAGKPSRSCRTESCLPKRYRRSPYSLMSLSVGHPNAGFQVRAKRLRQRPYLRIKRGSRRESYGHPALVLMLRRTARDVARAAPGSVMVVGDLSRKRGGPLAGHHSHQSGRDADIAFYMMDSKGRPIVPTRFVSFDGKGRARDGSGRRFDDARNWLMLRSFARDQRAGLAHIFVSRPLRRRLLSYGRRHRRFKRYVPKVAALLKQPEAASTHDDHFHVRISCPKRQRGLCHEQSKR